jgi:hypothetical protein
VRHAGRAAPKPLTTHQKAIVQKLLDAHGEDVQVRAWHAWASWFSPLAAGGASHARMQPGMAWRGVAGGGAWPGTRGPHLTGFLVRPQAWFRDTKLNRMQHSEGKLRELLESFKFHSGSNRHDFRAPRKPPKRL